ncbi:MAG TPA: hypothetical protein VF228_16470 [Iamia sp.]
MNLLGSSALVETAIGLALVFFLAAGVCTAVVEAVAGLWSFRAKLLWRTVARWFTTDDAIADTRKGISRALSLLKTDVDSDPTATPASGPIPARLRTGLRVGQAPDASSATSSTARADFIAALPGVTDDEASLRKTKSLNRAAAITALASTITPDEDGDQIARLIARLPADIRNDVAKRATWIEQWFDAEMARLGAAYRSRIRWYAGFVGLVLVVVMGLDTVHLADELYREPQRRQILVAAAESEVAADGERDTCPEDDTATTTTEAETETEAHDEAETTGTTAPGPSAAVRRDLACAESLVATIDGLDVSRWEDGPGWPSGLPDTLGGWATMLLGMGITVAALAVGAPWWYSVLKRLMGLRPGGRSDG